MALCFETFGEAKLAVIPLYPLAPWNDTVAKRNAKGKGEIDAPTFNENWNCKAIRRTLTALSWEPFSNCSRTELPNNGAAGAMIQNGLGRA